MLLAYDILFSIPQLKLTYTTYLEYYGIHVAYFLTTAVCHSNKIYKTGIFY